MSALFISSTLHSFAIALVGIYIPLYLLKITGQFWPIFAYFSFDSLMIVLTCLLASRVVERLGFRRSALLGCLFLLATITFLIWGETQKGWLILAAVASALATCHYWLPYHLIFAEDGRVSSFGRRLAVLTIFSQLATAGGPLIGGMLIFFFGFKALYLTTITVLVLSILPLTVMHHHPKHIAPSFAQLRALFRSLEGSNWLKVLTLSNFEVGVMDVVWPVFVFLTFNNSYEQVGSLASATLIFSLLVLAVSGQFTDRFNKRRLLTLGSWLTAGGWFLLSVVRSGGAIFLSSALLKGLRTFFYTPFDAVFYTKVAEEKVTGSLRFVVFRELCLHSSRCVSFAILAVLSLWFTPWVLLFIIAGLVVPLINHYLQKIIAS